MLHFHKPEHIDFQNFERSSHEVPFDVYYQVINSTTYGMGGYTFDVTSPSRDAALCRDVWIECSFRVSETAVRAIRNMFVDYTGATNAAGRPTVSPRNAFKLAVRQGNIIARATETFKVNINDRELYYYPLHYNDVLDRLFVSNTQSKHEFSASGGAFSSGNHGHRTDNVIYTDFDVIAYRVPVGFNTYDGVNPLLNATGFFINLIEGWWPNYAEANVDLTQDIYSNMRSTYPLRPEFYNPGFSERINKTNLGFRRDWVPDGSNQYSNAAAPIDQFQSEARIALAGEALPIVDQRQWLVTVRERLPAPLFKMYSTDDCHGVLPNVYKLMIQGQFVEPSKLFGAMFESDTIRTNLLMNVNWYRMDNTYAKIYLKWYMFPRHSLPKEIHVNCPLIHTQLRPITQANSNAAAAADVTIKYVDTNVNERDISLIAVPDLLLIYVIYDMTQVTVDHPGDGNLELINLKFNINASTMKTYGINSMLLYQMWKKNLNYKDQEIMQFDEWRKYCFVAALRPEDYGMKESSEFNQPLYLNVNCTARNWWINPSIWNGVIETLGGQAGAGTSFNLVVSSIYWRNKIHLQLDRFASCKLEAL